MTTILNIPTPTPTLADVEFRYILAVMKRNGGNVTATAKALGIARRTLGLKLKRWGLIRTPTREQHHEQVPDHCRD